ncbi:triphosphoribosyl-dephospho-CoA synthase [Halomarina oriensis]|uniref:Triphosphoribosyl-dephospho-CoA synthase n=1 Tax=Halomarina oriensis TaxID=671145 RepID=A0A6B0GTS3_9EURY|nr:triphosphoribosyl-dephospho-CoA synthase [Halomarina oriensis]MWG36013.1 triphosphoribosyl-dephospho-CoA synthase [Halomarina oriensis]
MSDDRSDGPPRRDVVQNAELALLLEVAGTPKPGNVDRHRDHADLHFDHFLAGAVGATPGLRLAAGDGPLGEAFERAVGGMSRQRGGNSQFGALLALCPLVRAASRDALTREGVRAAVAETTVEDTCSFYRAFDHVGVAVDDPPEGMSDLDVRQGSGAIPAVRERDLTLADLMAESAPGDGIAAEWTDGYPRTLRAAERIEADDGPVSERGARAFLHLLAERIDQFVATTSDAASAREATDRAQAVLDDEEDAEALAEEFVERGINPGTTADLTAAALFVALERGVEV